MSEGSEDEMDALSAPVTLNVPGACRDFNNDDDCSDFESSIALSVEGENKQIEAIRRQSVVATGLQRRNTVPMVKPPRLKSSSGLGSFSRGITQRGSEFFKKVTTIKLEQHKQDQIRLICCFIMFFIILYSLICRDIYKKYLIYF